MIHEDWQYRLVCWVDDLAHRIWGDDDLPVLCNMERRMYYSRLRKAEAKQDRRIASVRIGWPL